MGVNSSALCTVAKDIFFGCTPFVPESFFCAMLTDDGKGNSEEINKAAKAWGEASKQLREFHEELSGVAHSVPESEWKAADREGYEEELNKYLEQVNTSAIAAESASVILYAVETALYVYAAFALAEAAIVAADAIAVAAADATVVGAPEAEAEGAAVGAEAYEALETAGKVLLAGLTGMAAGIEAALLVEMGVQAVQGDKSAVGDFGKATLTGLKDDVKLLPNEIADYAKGRALGAAHEGAFGEGGGESGGSGEGESGSSGEGSGDGSAHTGADGSTEGGADGSTGSGSDAGADGSSDTGSGSENGSSAESGNADGGHGGDSGSGSHEDGSGGEKDSPFQPVGNDPIDKQLRSFFPQAPEPSQPESQGPR